MISIGQDESGFALNSMGKKRWIIKGKMPLLPKTEGNTLMVSMLINSFTGAGLKMLPSEIDEANAILRTMGLEEIKGKLVSKYSNWVQTRRDIGMLPPSRTKSKSIKFVLH